jgi:hypothetical protein
VTWWKFLSMSFVLRVKGAGRAASVILVVMSAAVLPNSVHAQCRVGWQTPRVLEVADGRAAYVESPVAIPTPAGILLLGVPSFIWAVREAFDPPPAGLDTAAYLTRWRKNFGLIGFLLRPDNTATPVRPPVSAPMRRLVAVSDLEGTTHVVGFAPLQGSDNPDSDGAVWYAQRRDDQWTAPTMVFSADRLDLSGQKAALLVRHESDIHIVVPFYRGHTSGIAYIRRINGLWTTIETRLGHLPSQATAQFIGADSLAVAFAGVGAPDVRVRNGQHVFLIRAAISDTVWPAPRLVHYSGLGGVRWLKMYEQPSTAGTTTLTLVWNRLSGDDRSSADTVYAMASADAGATWQTPQVLVLPFKVATLAQDRDARGTVHVVVTSSHRSGPKDAQMYHASLRNGRWSGLDSVLAGPVASVPTLSSVGPDSMLLVWGNARPIDARSPNTLAPVSKYTTFVDACP